MQIFCFTVEYSLPGEEVQRSMWFVTIDRRDEVRILGELAESLKPTLRCVGSVDAIDKVVNDRWGEEIERYGYACADEIDALWFEDWFAHIPRSSP